CGLSRHGSYPRVEPPGTRVARFRCPVARMTFSLLPDFLASRLSGTLMDVERVVDVVNAARSVEAAADVLRPDIELTGAIRWTRRRTTAVRAVLMTVVTMVPALLGCAPALPALRVHLGTTEVLSALRGVAEPHLQSLRHPVGFLAPRGGGRPRGGARQHEV